jgi:drug/metabolite transporter (DMT)-like permease
MQRYGKGAALMVAAAACLAVNDALCKLLMPQYPAGQIMAIRGAAMVLIFLGASLVFDAVRRGVTFRSKKMHALRAGLVGLSALLFLGGLSAMPLANAVALSFTSPLAVAALSRTMLGERVEAKRWLAIGVGFSGVLLILNPSLEHYGPASVLPVLGGLAIALSDLLTRRMSSDETAASIALSTGLGTALVGGCTFAFGWRWPEQSAVIVIGVASVFFLLAYVLMIQAFRAAPASYVAPFRYSALVWSLALAFVLWGQVPDHIVIIGAIMIIAAGIYLVRGRWTSNAAVQTPNN